MALGVSCYPGAGRRAHGGQYTGHRARYQQWPGQRADAVTHGHDPDAGAPAGAGVRQPDPANPGLADDLRSAVYLQPGHGSDHLPRVAGNPPDTGRSPQCSAPLRDGAAPPSRAGLPVFRLSGLRQPVCLYYRLTFGLHGVFRAVGDALSVGIRLQRDRHSGVQQAQYSPAWAP